MFTSHDIYKRVHTQPFLPLRIVTSSGESFEVRHSDLIMVGRRFVEVGTASDGNPGVFEQVNRVSVMHITALEDLPANSKSGGNGSRRKRTS
jgi:hypothetical protein